MNQNSQNFRKTRINTKNQFNLQSLGLIFLITIGLIVLPIFGEPELTNHLEKIQKQKNHKKPVVVVIGENQYTELTDFVVPYGILKRADIADLYPIAPNKGTMNMFPTLSIEITTSINDFDSSHPEGADLVIVPAIHNSENKTITEWIQQQYQKGATVVGICDGVWTLGFARLLKNKKATGHWYSKEGLSQKFPDTEWIQNRRYVQDQRIITTTGVTASIPISLALVESIAGTKKANSLAIELGVTNWDPHHKSEEFHFDWKTYLSVTKNLTFFWSHETIGIPIYDGIDEVSLALVADSYSRTYRSKAVATTNTEDSVITKSGLRFFSESKTIDKNKIHSYIQIEKNKKAFDGLKESLSEIQKRYGRTTMKFVASQLEFPLD
ncbi:DJ-1/PfpI family protein [Leptospira kanakyensis]|uniref:DJ-1/PfpI family protein n=1 Tax=Leptospira kanakyensis TaxID=2484968 RepID=A0A6N4QQD7_9LEPT|nr:DJ-1/PfpI family protein [Leptospira kanakyensis]TGK55513.1 DJ-1/PfpI family protein [Leptospira kanakyensis]TGK61047.1 DJ-1/PfpI family protein [Leptospira kanakyensis]TGK76480.1 DJ-1/PfpI family protein [Leptospira kanakyensis]